MNSFVHERCSKCVLSISFPKIEFDQHGVCNFCRDERFISTEAQIIEKARRQIQNLFDDKRGKAEYDAIMCFSGGKDSSYTLLRAVKHYQLKVLALTLDNGFISPVAHENIRRFVDLLGVDHIMMRPSQHFFNALVRVSAVNKIYNLRTLARVSSICYSCISIVNNMALKMALEKEIPFILAGFTLGQIPANSILYRNVYPFLQESREPFLKKLRQHLGTHVDDYLCIPKSLLDRITSYPYTVNILCVEDFSEEEIIEQIQKFGWVPPADVDGCSSNCMLNTFNNFIHEKIYHFHPYELEFSHLIRKGQLTREDALKKINRKPERLLDSLIDKIGFTIHEIKKINMQ